MDDKIEGIVTKMDNNIKRMVDIYKSDNEIIGFVYKTVHSGCPSEYGLKDIESCHYGNECGICWEQALENIKDE